MTEILCRVDRATRTPVVFITDTVDYENNSVLSWIKGEPQVVSLNYYHQTGPLSAADEEVLRTRYARNFNDPEVIVRHRLPRTKRELTNILAKPGRPKKEQEPLTSIELENQNMTAVFDKRASDKPAAPVVTPAPAQEPTPAEAPTPQQLFAAIEQMRVETAKAIAMSMEQLNNAIAAHTRPARKSAAPAKKARAKRNFTAPESRKPAARKISTKL